MPVKQRNVLVPLLATALGLTAGLMSCGGSEPEPETAAGVVPTGTYPYPTGPVTYPPYTGATSSTAAATSSAPNAMAPIEPALQQAVQAVLNQLATREAPGAKPVGETRIALLATNQTTEQSVTLKPGKCYTVIASALLPVTEVNVQMFPAVVPVGVNLVLAQDQTQGAQAVLGQGANCYKWALSAEGTVRIVTTVAAGAGVVATQVYEK
jgi:hypothetical protein